MNNSKYLLFSSRFLRYLSFKFKVERQRHTEYNGLLTYFNLETLNKIRDYLHYGFLQKLLNNSIDNKSARNKNFFLINNISKNYLRSSPTNILMTIGNTMEVNLF